MAALRCTADWHWRFVTEEYEGCSKDPDDVAALHGSTPHCEATRVPALAVDEGKCRSVVHPVHVHSLLFPCSLVCVCACLCFLQCERTTILLASYGLVTIFVLMCAYINLLFGTCPLSVRCSVGVRRLTCSLVCLACRRQVYTVTVSGVGHCLPECLCHRCLCRGPLPHPLQGPLCAVHAVGVPAPSASVCGTVCQVRHCSLAWALGVRQQ